MITYSNYHPLILCILDIFQKEVRQIGMFVPRYVSMHESSEYDTITLFAVKSFAYLDRAIWLFGVRLFAYPTL